MSAGKSARMSARVWGAALAALALACAAPARAQQPDAPDTSALGRYFDALSDSSAARFGGLAAPADTAGLDSARVYAIAHPARWRSARDGRHLELGPVFDFNRVDGPVLGGGFSIGQPARRLGRLSADVADATGPNIALGGARWTRRLDRGDTRWELRLRGARKTEAIDREQGEHGLAAIGAFLFGNDRTHYLQRDGARVRLSREGHVLRLVGQYRDELESARATTATWSAFGRRARLPYNLPAANGRARELAGELLWRVPGSPIVAQLQHATSGEALNSAFEYRRTRVSAGADVALGRTFALVPQAEYGALTTGFVPQAAFFLGGPHTLRSLPADSLGGTRLALARLELVLVRDPFDLLHLPHPIMFPVQLAAFAAAGAVWGRDPYGGPTRPGGDWPHAGGWRSEVGLSLMYQPGFPEPTTFVRFNWAAPVGPGAHGSKLTLALTRGLDLVGVFERE